MGGKEIKMDYRPDEQKRNYEIGKETEMKTSRTKIKPVDVYLDGEYIGTANEIITNRTGAYYAVDGEYLQDNGEYIPVGGYGVETK